MSILLKNAVLFTEQDSALRADVRVEDGKIKEVAPELSVVSDEQVIDLNGYTVYPGFISTHVHVVHDGEPFSQEIFREFVRNGCTTMRDMAMMTEGDIAEPLAKIKAMSDSCYPRVLTCGKFVCTPKSYGSVNPEGKHIGEVAHSPEEAAAIVNRFADMGCDGIKTASDPGNLFRLNAEIPSNEFFLAIFKAAEERGMWVSAHIQMSELLEKFVDLGKFEAAHVPMDPMPESLVQKLKEKDICVCTTLTAYAMMAKMTGMDALLNIPVENTRRLYEAGVRLATGNDMVADNGFFEHGIPIVEMQLMAKAGMSVNDIIRSSTIEAARTCWLENETGSIEPGKSADLIAIKAPVDETFECFRNIPLVINRGDVIVNNV